MDETTAPAQGIDIPQTVESDWKTAPNTPRHSEVDLQSSLGAKLPSFSAQVKESDWYWDWQNSDAEFERELSSDTTQGALGRPQSISVEPGLAQTQTEFLNGNGEDKKEQDVINAGPGSSSFFCLPATRLISTSSYTPVSLSCTPTSSNSVLTPMQTTDPGDLPGNTPTVRGDWDNDVITTPPQGGRSRSSSSSNMKSRSIQEMGERMADYVPTAEVKLNPKSLSSSVPKAIQSPSQGGDFLGPFCLSYMPRGSSPPLEEVVKPLVKEEDEDEEDLLDGVPPNSMIMSAPPPVQPVKNLSVYTDFLKSQTCYSIIPRSTKIVVLDTRLRVKKAFFALVANGIRSAPLWDSRWQEFVGMLTITDFIHILRHHYKSPIVRMDELEEQTIQEWIFSEREFTKIKPKLVSIDPMESLHNAIDMLVKHKIHRLPVIERRSGNAIYILTHKRILHHLYHNVICCADYPTPPYMQRSIGDLRIGTYSSIATTSPDTAIIGALNVFADRRISALPIVTPDGEVVDIYAKFDVINLAAERIYNNLDVSLRDALKHRAQGFEGVQTCKASDSLLSIINKIVSAKVHRLVIVDDQKHVVGVVSLSDILRFLILTEHE